MSELVRVTRGIWRPAEQVETVAGRCAAILACAPVRSVVAGIAAARLHGFWLPQAAAGERVELILRRHAQVPRAHGASRRAEIRARRRTLAADEVVRVNGLPVTSPARTWLDLAEWLPVEDLVAAGDGVLRGGEPPAALTEVVRRAGHRRGVVRARECIPLLNARSRSRPESHLRVGLALRGLPEPGVNEPVVDADGQWLGEPDLSYESARLALEYNGAGHAETDRMRRDITREVDFASRGGWHMVTFGPVQVFRRMDQVAALVRELLRERTR